MKEDTIWIPIRVWRMIWIIERLRRRSVYVIGALVVREGASFVEFLFRGGASTNGWQGYEGI